jgi:UDP-N-acetylmuramoyl-tripeptide--D-alanyl-D-alanine ligase
MPVVNKKQRWLRQVLRRMRARMKRRRLGRTTVLAVTGSCGKTTTSSFLAKILSDHDSCYLGLRENDENSVMRSLRSVKVTDRYYVQEVSGHCPGQLARVLPLIRHQVGIVTTVGLDHYRVFRDRSVVAKEKATMVNLLPESGVAVLNADDPNVLAMASLTPASVLTYGQSECADVRATHVRSAWPERLSVTVNYQGESAYIETCLFGDILLSSLLAAVAGGLAVGVSLQQCAKSLQGLDSIYGRMSVHRSSKGLWIVNDSLKAPFWTVKNVMTQMEHAVAPRKTLVFGSFSDTVGSDSDKYRKTARWALEFVERVVFVGKKASHLHKLMTPELEGRLFVFQAIDDAAQFLMCDVVEDELVLIKSGKIEHLERLIYAQESEPKCWIQSCQKNIDCRQCEESGLI